MRNESYDEFMAWLQTSQERGRLAAVDVDSIHTAQWVPPEGAQPTQVHLLIVARGKGPDLLIRFKGPGTLQELVEQLAMQRLEVWPRPKKG